MPPVDIKPRDLDTVLAILHKHIPHKTVVAFGSRVIGAAKPFSDLDLAVLGSEPISSATLGNLNDDFDESDLPFKVDIVDWATTAESFRRIIERDGIRIVPTSR